MFNYEKDTKIDKVIATCSFVSCCAINMFNLDRAKEVKRNLIAINQRQQGSKEDCSVITQIYQGKKIKG